MKFIELAVPGAWHVEMEPLADERGFFARSFCADEFARRGLDPGVNQCSISFNRLEGTLRGMHYQAEPHREAKLVRVTRGAIFDVALDLRANSPTYLRWCALELSADNHGAIYLPPGLAHGFMTLADNTEVLYQISTAFVPESSRGVRWNDPAFGIKWPAAPRVMSERDRAYPDYQS